MSDRRSLRFRYALSSAALSVALLATGPVHGALLAEQGSGIAESLKEEAQRCAAGNVEGTIGKAIQDALDIHLEMASSLPNTESLFSPISDCFAGLMQIWDLSFAIPSLASIMGAVNEALLQYAQKKICTAVQQTVGMVIGPINQAIAKVNEVGNIDGLVQGVVGGALATIDPALGSEYARASGGAYEININAFQGIDLDFGGGGSGGSQAGLGDVSGVVDQLGGDLNQIGGLNNQLADLQKQVGPAQQQVAAALAQLAQCEASDMGSCDSFTAAVARADENLAGINRNIDNLIDVLMGGGGTQGSSSAASGGSSGGSLLDHLGSYFD